MSFKFQDETIGSLSQATGIITLNPSVLKIGGQYYSTATLTRTISSDVTLVANTLYMIYAVLVSGIVSLRISANVNSIGPAGFTAWKLVGAFYSDGLASVSFGSFVNITGKPVSGIIPYAPTFDTSWGTASSVDFKWSIDGDRMKIIGAWKPGTTTTGSPTISMPFGSFHSGFIADSPNSKMVGTWERGVGALAGFFSTTFSAGKINAWGGSNQLALIARGNGTSGFVAENTSTMATSGDFFSMDIEFVNASLSLTALEDL